VRVSAKYASPAGVPQARPFHALYWAVLILPFGLAGGYLSVAVPFVLRARGLDMSAIASISAVASLPYVWKIVWTPALDAGWPRKNWYLLSIGLTAVLLGATALIPPDRIKHLGPLTFLTLYTAALTLAQASVSTSTSAVLAMMAVCLPASERARASGWQAAGNVAGTSAGGAAVLWLVGHTTPMTTAAVLALACLTCAVPVFYIIEAPLPKRRVIPLILALAKDLWATVRSPSGWTFLIICLSPVGAGGVSNLFSALSTDYAQDAEAREHMVLLANGIGAGLAGAIGALAGGYLTGRMNVRIAYLLFGGLTAIIAIGMILAPATPTAFDIGCLAYYFSNGLCYAAFFAFLFDVMGGTGGNAVSTKISMFVSASNVAISYVTWLDGVGYDAAQRHWVGYQRAGRAGMLGTDALTSFLGIAVVALMLIAVDRAKARRDTVAV
jgi:MFS transporter, PAT family, beta-lactamase induction signal transducer AmpG